MSVKSLVFVLFLFLVIFVFRDKIFQKVNLEIFDFLFADWTGLKNR